MAATPNMVVDPASTFETRLVTNSASTTSAYLETPP
jgi:hypothetical protein